MSREIKFRAWDKYQEKMIYENQEVRSGHTFAGVGWGGFAITVSDDDIAMQDSVLEVMRSTSLKDRNGVEVYEDDIVRIYSYGLATIYWNDISLRFLIKPLGSVKSIRSIGAVRTQGTVIGNIYENPELLEKSS